MKSLVIIVAVAVTVGASRPSRAYDAGPDYQDGPTFFDSPPPPLPSSSRPSFFGSSYLRSPQPFAEDSSIFGEPPEAASSYREGRIYFDSPPPGSSYYPSARRPQSFYQDSFSAENPLGSAKEYHGPPPPAPSSGETPRKPTSLSATRDERPPYGPFLDSSSTKSHEESKGQQQQQPTTIEQPLSFGGHSSYLSYGDHSLGFASVAAVTAPDINPLAGLTSTTRAAATSGSTISMQSPSTMMTSYPRQNTPPHPPPPPPEMQTSAPPTPSSSSLSSTASKITIGQSSISTVRLNEPASTTPATTTTRLTSVPPKSGLDPVQNGLNQITSVPMLTLQQNLKTAYDFRGLTQGLPSSAHGNLPIEAPKQQFQIPDIKNNFLIYDSKSSFPFDQPNIPFNQQSSGASSNNENSNNNITPVRFSIPTAPITPALASQTSAPIRIAIQGLDFSRGPITFTAVPANTNTFAAGQNQIDTMQMNKLNSAPTPNTAGSAPPYFIVQNNEQNKPAASQVGSAVPLGSFYVLNEQTRQALQGLQLQLNGLSGLEYLAAPGNADQTRSASSDAAKVALNLQIRPDAFYPKIEYQQPQQQPGRW